MKLCDDAEKKRGQDLMRMKDHTVVQWRYLDGNDKRARPLEKLAVRAYELLDGHITASASSKSCQIQEVTYIAGLKRTCDTNGQEKCWALSNITSQWEAMNQL